MSEMDEIYKEQAEEVYKIREDRVGEIWEAAEESDEETEEELMAYAEKSLSEVLAKYSDDDRNYVVDGAEIKCSKMSRKVYCMKYENGKTRLYNIANPAVCVERDFISPEGKPGETISFGKTINITKARSLFALHAEKTGDNKKRFATVIDRECSRNIGGDSKKTNIFSCGNCGILRQTDIAEIEKSMNEAIEYGTCYSLIKPVTEWVNPLCMEKLSGQCDNDVSNTIYSGGTVKTVCIRTDHHKPMKFDTDCGEKEGLTMLSTLLCTRGGVITVEWHGQICFGYDIEDRIQELMDSIRGEPRYTLDKNTDLSTVEILARMIYQESHTYKYNEQNAVAYSFINRVFDEEKYTDDGQIKTLKNMLFANLQYESLETDWKNYPNAHQPPISPNDDDGEKEGWENAKRLAAVLVVALEDNVPVCDSDGDIGEIDITNIGDYKEDTCEMICHQRDSNEKLIENPIGDRTFFHRVEGDYVAKEGEIIMHTDGKEENAGNVFLY